jgi:ABC-type phosphate transport system substrate-binding protein
MLAGGGMFVYADENPAIVIGHPNVEDTLTRDEVKQIFLGRKTRWNDDSKIVFVIYREKDVYDAFLKEYVNKTIFQYTNYWKKQVFTGKGRMPKSFKTCEEVMEFVSSTEGAISFVLANDVDTNLVNTLTIEE